jgi:hypothetical protein
MIGPMGLPAFPRDEGQSIAVERGAFSGGGRWPTLRF